MTVTPQEEKEADPAVLLPAADANAVKDNAALLGTTAPTAALETAKEGSPAVAAGDKSHPEKPPALSEEEAARQNAISYVYSKTTNKERDGFDKDKNGRLDEAEGEAVLKHGRDKGLLTKENKPIAHKPAKKEAPGHDHGHDHGHAAKKPGFGGFLGGMFSRGGDHGAHKNHSHSFGGFSHNEKSIDPARANRAAYFRNQKAEEKAARGEKKVANDKRNEGFRKEFDRDGDGTISKDELTAAMSNPNAKENIKGLVKDWDYNGTKTVNDFKFSAKTAGLKFGADTEEAIAEIGKTLRGAGVGDKAIVATQDTAAPKVVSAAAPAKPADHTPG